MITPPSFHFKVPFRRVKTPAQIDENNYITNRAVCQGDFFKNSRGIYAPRGRLRAGACGFGIDQVDCFFVLPDGTREDPRVGPSLDFPGPRGEEGAPSLNRKRCSMGAKRVSYKDYRGLTKLVSLILLKYALRRGCSYSVLVHYSMKVHSVNVRSESDTYPLHLHLDEVKRADTRKQHNPALSEPLNFPCHSTW